MKKQYVKPQIDINVFVVNDVLNSSPVTTNKYEFGTGWDIFEA